MVQPATRPRWRRLKRTVKVVGLAILLLILVWEVAGRSWAARWGATDAEVARTWPGDGMLVNPAAAATHAITIDAPPQAIWRWLVEVGQDRAGFFSYDWLEQAVGADIHNTFEIRPEWQTRQAGDDLWMAPKRVANGQVRLQFVRVEPYRVMLMVPPADFDAVTHTGKGATAVWAWYLEPLNEKQTRLVMKLQGTKNAPLSVRALSYVLWDNAHFVMERKMLLTLKALAEGRHLVAAVSQHYARAKRLMLCCLGGRTPLPVVRCFPANHLLGPDR